MEEDKNIKRRRSGHGCPGGAVERGGQIFYVTVREKAGRNPGSFRCFVFQVSVRDRQGQRNAVLLPTGKGRNNQWPEKSFEGMSDAEIRQYMIERDKRKQEDYIYDCSWP